MVTWLAVALGGAGGSVARYGVGLLLERSSATFPVGTLTVNVVGGFLIGLLSRWLSQPALDPVVRIALTVGFCGGFTTFSTFSAELLAMVQEGRLSRAVGYIVLSVTLALAATFAGFALGERLLAPARS